MAVKIFWKDVSKKRMAKQGWFSTTWLHCFFESSGEGDYLIFGYKIIFEDPKGKRLPGVPGSLAYLCTRHK